MKILVTGGRDCIPPQKIYLALDHINRYYGPVSQLIVGDARGTDAYALDWAKINNIPYEPSPYKADWKKYPKAAGVIRNAQMLKENPDIDFAVAFPGDKGTTDMVNRILLNDIKLYRFYLREGGGLRIEDVNA